MKHARKTIINEPYSLRSYRETPNASYAGYTDKNIDSQGNEAPPLKLALALEQGYICCYCMARIGWGPSSVGSSTRKFRVNVEHYISQKHHISSPLEPNAHKEKELDYMNLLGACDQLNGRNCSGIRENIWLTIDPRKIQCETQIQYRKNGEAHSDDSQVKNDISTLGLNSSDLIRNRKAVIDLARSRIQPYFRKSSGTIPKGQLEKEIEFWSQTDDGKYREYCVAAVQYLESKLRLSQ